MRRVRWLPSLSVIALLVALLLVVAAALLDPALYGASITLALVGSALAVLALVE